MARLTTRCGVCKAYIEFIIDSSDIDKFYPCPKCQVSLKLAYIGDGVFEIGRAQNATPVATAPTVNYDVWD